jgi:hypothetical protein
MSTSRRTRRFTVAFVIAIAVVAVAVAARGGRSPDATEETLTPVTTEPTATSSTPRSTLAIVETTAAPTTVPAIGVLPVIDLDEECVLLFGDGATPSASEVGPPMACRDTNGEERPFDADSACEARYGAGLLSVKVLTDDGGVWKCLVADRVALGQPDWQGHCEAAYGPEAIAFVYQSNSSGWACASVRNGIYLEEFADLDQACHIAFGRETFGIALKVEDGGTPADNVCYGARP